MDYIIFNGVSSADLGFIIEKLPDEKRAARDMDEIGRIQGRHGREFRDHGTYGTYEDRITVNLNGHTTSELYAWLEGYGWLTTSDSPGWMREAYFIRETDDERFRTPTGPFDSVTLTAVFEPFLYLVNAEDVTFTQSAVFSGQGNYYSEPLIAVTGSGDVNLMINGATVLIDGLSGTMHIDCDAKIAYTLDDGEIDLYMQPVSIIDNTWPTLKPGTNANMISWSGNISKVTITPRWRCCG